MIVQSILNFLASLIGKLIGGLPALPAGLATALGNLPGQVGTLFGYVGRLQPVLPLDQITTAFQLVLGAVGFYVVVKIGRQVISYATGGGGGQ